MGKQEIAQNLENVNFVEVECATSKTVEYLFIGEETECSVSRYRQQVVGNEGVDLPQSARHAVQLRRRYEVVEIARSHSAEKVALAEFYHRCNLRAHNITQIWSRKKNKGERRWDQS